MMARAAAVQAPSSAITHNGRRKSCSFRTPQLCTLQFRHIVWKPACSHHAPLLMDCRTSNTNGSQMAGSSLPSTETPRRIIIGAYRAKCSRRSSIAITMSATADSDQSSPSHEGDGERAVGCYKEDEKAVPKNPSPEIEPGDVVDAQLQALKCKDFVTVFEFASPKNKAHTGPLPRFTEMIQGRAYNVMVGHTSAEVLSSLSIGIDRFQQRVLIKGANGKQAIFSWSLSRQDTGPFQDCWMTDSVHRDE